MRGFASFVGSFAFAACLAFGAYSAVIFWADMPQVHYSYSTGECVKVVDFAADSEGRASEYSCDALPKRFDRVWVE